ncbi:FAD-binding protein [Pelagicoccus enzymogenes]|uniref:phytoene desaturase family protein n=1 Tax=Pelagicoccus enzymogenes TaxID=2773457 RepID=UPI00280F8F1C|nr:NAD(P)-binding protein [Pelagicoccus enzymogenes]MDQ8198481.1 FAD-binding protein [Pelagicoccus enzymogenes]
MGKNWLEGVEEEYDVVVIGSGLGGLTSANILAKCGHKVLLLEHHYQFGGLATWFKRPGKHIFDISLHGFPHGMVKSCRKYWTKEIADSIHQLKDVRFINPQFDVWTTFDRQDFTRILVEDFKLEREQVEGFYTHLRQMNFYDDDKRTTRELFEEFFPGRKDVHRLLLEPIAYANGSTLDEPAITYGIVFSNFMSKGVFTFQGGTDVLIGKMVEELERNGATLKKNVLVRQILTEEVDGKPQVTGVVIEGRTRDSEPDNVMTVRSKAVVSNANVVTTVKKMVGEEKFSKEYLDELNAVRINSSSCQVYMGIKEGETIPNIGDLVFTSDAPVFSSEELVDLHTTSRTFSVYYPETRPGTGRYTVVASLNAKMVDWENLSDEEYEKHKERLIEESLVSLEKYIPGVREKIDHLEAATPRTINHYTRHPEGTSFGTKFEGLKSSMELPEQVTGLYHAGSVGIIMSGWLGSMNYGVITSNKVDKQIVAMKAAATGKPVA